MLDYRQLHRADLSIDRSVKFFRGLKAHTSKNDQEERSWKTNLP